MTDLVAQLLLWDYCIYLFLKKSKIGSSLENVIHSSFDYPSIHQKSEEK